MASLPFTGNDDIVGGGTDDDQQSCKTFHEEQKEDETLLTKEAELVGIYMEGPFISMEKKGCSESIICA